ncbi:MAG: TIGR03545 family protein [Planctomycetes bacterium]|nr:TIGR03545 family protein [Planctomycetota bacterium]
MRWKGIITFAVILALMALFSFFFMDNLIKWGMETTGTMVTGAKTEINSLELSFARLSFSLNGLQSADPDNEWQSRLEIKDIRFKMNWRPLLEGKVEIEEMAVEGIRSGTKRTTSGKLPAKEIPPPDPVVEKEKKSLSDQTEDVPALKILKGEQKVNVDDVVKPNELTAPAEIQKANDELDKRHKNSMDLLNNLNLTPRIDSIKKQIEDINIKEKDPRKLKKELDKAKDVKKDIDKLKNDVKVAENQVRSDYAYVDTAMATIDQLKQKDYEAALKTITEAKGITGGDISRLALGPVWLDRAQSALKWYKIIKDLMPAGGPVTETPKAKAFTGMDIAFPKKKGYPAFLLKKVVVTTGEKSSDELKFSGVVEHISSDQNLSGKPTVISLTSTSPVFTLDGMMKHDATSSEDLFVLSIKDYDLKGFSLGDSKFLPKTVSGGRADIHAALVSSGGKTQINITILPRELVFAPEDMGQSEATKQIAGVLSSSNDIRIEALVSIDGGKFSWKIKSNLDDKISDAVKNLIAARMEDAKAQIKQKIDASVDQQKQELMNKLQSKRVESESKLKEKNSSLDGLDKLFESKTKGLVK